VPSLQGHFQKEEYSGLSPQVPLASFYNPRVPEAQATCNCVFFPSSSFPISGQGRRVTSSREDWELVSVEGEGSDSLKILSQVLGWEHNCHWHGGRWWHLLFPTKEVGSVGVHVPTEQEPAWESLPSQLCPTQFSIKHKCKQGKINPENPHFLLCFSQIGKWKASYNLLKINCWENLQTRRMEDQMLQSKGMRMFNLI
jgi:hypothetical protein